MFLKWLDIQLFMCYVR